MPAAGHDADPRVRVREPGALGRDQEVALERELEPARHRRAVHRADHGLVDLGPEPPVVARGGIARRRRRLRLAPDEPSSFRSRPAQNAGSAPVTITTSTSSSVAELTHPLAEVDEQRGAQGVARLGTVERHGGDTRRGPRPGLPNLPTPVGLSPRAPTLPGHARRRERRAVDLEAGAGHRALTAERDDVVVAGRRADRAHVHRGDVTLVRRRVRRAGELPARVVDLERDGLGGLRADELERERGAAEPVRGRDRQLDRRRRRDARGSGPR